MTLDALEQLKHGHPESVGDHLNGIKCRVGLAVFDAAQVCLVEAALFSKYDLAHAGGETKLSHTQTESLSQVDFHNHNYVGYTVIRINTYSYKVAFKLSLITLVHPPSNDGDSTLDVSLLRRANAWLQRRNLGVLDDLLLIGVGFDDEPTLQEMLIPYGLISAEFDVIPPDQLDESDGTALGESVESIARGWISKHHGDAIPVVKWTKLISSAAYSMEDWWWVGLTATNDEQSSLADILGELLPAAFNKQAMTWATIIAECGGLSPDGEEHEAHDAAMEAVALARWLTGFDAATENNFYDFSASGAIEAGGLDTLRLGFEAGRNHRAELDDYFDGNDETDEGLAAACLLACLDERMGAIRATLTSAFGDDSLLFWSLYRSIWPDLKRPSDENMNGLLSLSDVEIGDIERPWLFVKDGWIEFAEE